MIKIRGSLLGVLARGGVSRSADRSALTLGCFPVAVPPLAASPLYTLFFFSVHSGLQFNARFSFTSLQRLHCL